MIYHRRDRLDYRDPNELAFTQIADPTAPADAVMDGRHREDRVREALESLPPDQLKLVRLAFFSGLSHSEIAEATALPLGTVKSRLRLAFTRLRRTLEREGVLDAGDVRN